MNDGEIYFTHVDCLPVFEASKKLKTTPTDELRDFLGFLMLNTRFDLENWLDRHKRLRDSGLHN